VAFVRKARYEVFTFDVFHVRNGRLIEHWIFQIKELRPRHYSVTFALQGFSAVRREAVELSDR
jgi:hypothetical protein